MTTTCVCGHQRAEHSLSRRRDGAGYDTCTGQDRRALAGTRHVGFDQRPALVACGCQEYRDEGRM